MWVGRGMSYGQSLRRMRHHGSPFQKGTLSVMEAWIWVIFRTWGQSFVGGNRYIWLHRFQSSLSASKMGAQHPAFGRCTLEGECWTLLTDPLEVRPQGLDPPECCVPNHCLCRKTAWFCLCICSFVVFCCDVNLKVVCHHRSGFCYFQRESDRFTCLVILQCCCPWRRKCYFPGLWCDFLERTLGWEVLWCWCVVVFLFLVVFVIRPEDEW